MKVSGCFRRPRGARRAQRGYLLLVILLMLAVLIIALAAAAPRIAQQIRRDREEETIHRGTAYARAIRLFYRKFGRYPTSLKELQDTNNLRFLRQQYKDPLSPNGEWRIIHYGQARVTPTGFGSQPGGGGGGPGQPGGGAAGQLGAGGMAGSGAPGAMPGSMGGPGQSGSPDASTGGAAGSSPSGPSTSGSSSSGSSSSGSSGSGGTTFGGGAIIGVAPLNNGVSIKEVNGKNHYNEWEFVYDPRFDLSNRQVVVPGAGGPGGSGGNQPGPSPSPSVPPMNPR